MTKTLNIFQETFFFLTDRRRLAFYFFLVLVLMAGYVYLLHTSVLFLHDREVALEQANDLETAIAILETESLAIKETINLDLAKAEGFSELATEPIFAHQNETVRLTLAVDNEI